jgi:hypothetical protein
MTLTAAWPHRASADPGIRLWETLLHARPDLALPPGAVVLELGCLETPWAALLKACRPDLTLYGVDARASSDEGPPWGGDHFLQADASTAAYTAQLPAAGVDAVVSLSAIEHLGLGWYGDPQHGDWPADVCALAIASALLRPGGWLYYDVPWHPLRPHTTAHYRCYTDDGTPDTDLPHVGILPAGCAVTWRGWVQPEREDMLLPARPTTPPDAHPFYYAATLIECREPL